LLQEKRELEKELREKQDQIMDIEINLVDLEEQTNRLTKKI